MAGWLVPLLALVWLQQPARLVGNSPGWKGHLRWSPDGNQFLFTRIHQGRMELAVQPAAGGDAVALVKPAPGLPHFDGAYSPDGRSMVYVHDILQGTDGKLQINGCKADGTQPEQLVPHKAFEESPRWSPDGTRLAFVSTRDGNQEIYTCLPGGKEVKRLTSHPGFDHHPAWSPDGGRIAFISSREGPEALWVMRADGTELRRLTRFDGLESWPAWHPDGKQLVVARNRAGQSDLVLVPADRVAGRDLAGETERYCVEHPAQDSFPFFSPDGRRLAFLSDRAGGWAIHTVDFPAKLAPLPARKPVGSP